MTLFDFETGQFIRAATAEEVAASILAAEMVNGTGAFSCEAEGGRLCVADGTLDDHVVFAEVLDEDGHIVWNKKTMQAVTLEHLAEVDNELVRRDLHEIAILCEGQVVGKVTR